MPATTTINADLHSHSTVSDGWLSPSALVARAAANGVTLLALTDHDEVNGIDEARTAARSSGIHFVAGVEISVTFADETIHIVGLDIDHQHPLLVDGLTHIRSGRQIRASRIAEALAQAGIHNALEGAQHFVRNPALISRAHFARFIVQCGIMPDVKTVFEHYLARGKPGYVKHTWAQLEDAVAWIKAAGGIAVIAHPARYRLSSADMHTLFDRFIAAGGTAVEVVSGAHTPQEMERFAAVARSRNLLASRASDFHGEHESPVDIGHCRPLPPDLTPVWTQFNGLP